MAQKVISEITVDVNGTSTTYTTLKAKQGDDKSRLVRAKITNNGETFSIDSTDSIFVNFKRGDQRGKSFAAKLLSDGKVEFEIPFWALELAQTVRCDISIVDVKNNKLTTVDFYIEVDAAAVSDSDVQADESVSYLLQLIEKTEELAKDYQGYFVTDDESTTIDITLADRTQWCYKNSQGVSSCAITIPTIAKQGWVAELTFITGNQDVNVVLNNYSSFTTQLIKYMQIESYTAPANHKVTMLFSITGLDAICTIKEFAK